MTDSRPFPMHVPTLTEVVEEVPIAETVLLGGDALTSAAVAPRTSKPPVDVPVLDEVVFPDEPIVPMSAEDPVAMGSGAAPVAAEPLPHVEDLLDAPDLSDSGLMVAAAESGALTPELADQLTDQITENMSAAMRPFIEGLAQQIALQMQEEFGQRLRAMVSQAVVQELNKRRL